MPFVASVSSFLVPRRKVRFGELFDSMSGAAFDIFSILYLSKLGHVVIDFQSLVASCLRQNFDHIESIYICFYISLNICSFQGFNFHSFL